MGPFVHRSAAITSRMNQRAENKDFILLHWLNSQHPYSLGAVPEAEDEKQPVLSSGGLTRMTRTSSWSRLPGAASILQEFYERIPGKYPGALRWSVSVVPHGVVPHLKGTFQMPNYEPSSSQGLGQISSQSVQYNPQKQSFNWTNPF
jgi:hypothetical protein